MCLVEDNSAVQAVQGTRLSLTSTDSHHACKMLGIDHKHNQIHELTDPAMFNSAYMPKG